MQWVKQHTGADLRYTVDLFEVLIVGFFVIGAAYMISSVISESRDGKTRHLHRNALLVLGIMFSGVYWLFYRS